ncbi:RidA family protein [bacterium]|nr:RidA family protein [candidate division CSSED10-310 bacterium]
MGKRTTVLTDRAPAAIGPYSQAIRAGDFLFISGQLPIDPITGSIVEGGTAGQAEQVLANLGGILAAENLSPMNVVKVTIFLKDMNDFATVNEIYGRMFHTEPPARECVEVARLPKDVRIEISLIAIYQ